MTKIRRNLPNNQYLAAILANSPSTSNVFATMTDLNALIGDPASYTDVLQHDVKYGEQINKGQAAYVSGSDGTNMIVSKASNNAESTSSKTMGLVIETGNTNHQSKIITEGLLEGLDTTAAQQGDPVWLGVNGNLLYGLANKPVAPAHMVFIGIVTRVNANNGEIFVKVQNGYELNELHDVSLPSYTDKGVLYRDVATNLWKHATITTLLGYTPANNTFTIATSAPLNGASDLSGIGMTLSITQASGSTSGYLSNTDWTTFNNKVPTTRSISTTAPLTGGGDLSVNRTFSIPKATSLVDGYLSALDFAIFNGKQAALGFTPANIAGDTFTGNIFAANLAGTNTGDETLTTIKTKLGAASASQDGYLTQADWSTFNGKQNAIGYTPANKAGETFTGNISAPNLSGTNTGDETTASVKSKLGVATSSIDGYLLATDWVIFNAKVSTSLTISTTAPLQGGGDLSGNRTLSITQAGAVTDGYLSSANWNTFNNKQNSITLTTTGTSGAATFDGSTLNIPQYTSSTVSSLIPDLKGNEVFRGVKFRANSTTIDTEGGITNNLSGTQGANTVATTNFRTRQITMRFEPSVVTTGAYCCMRTSAALWSITAGFLFVGEFGIADTNYAVGAHNFWGLTSSIANLAIGTISNSQPSALANIIALANDSGDANLQIMHNDASGTATKIDLGSNFPANRTSGAVSTAMYHVRFYNAPGSSEVSYRVENRETGDVAEGTITTNLPDASTLLAYQAGRSMGTGGGGVSQSGRFDVKLLGVYNS